MKEIFEAHPSPRSMRENPKTGLVPTSHGTSSRNRKEGRSRAALDLFCDLI